ncbi:MAG TPA: Ig-like domain-containing protein, partial [Treponemataceae bacterium]|nr:Ig-like domain-containing protein [Treponemataceae bacterium]
MNKKLLLLLSFLIILIPLFASGKKEVDERSVDELESWQETFDINEKKAGKYNIMITAADKGGNIALGGPFNIFIDPESDLPVSGITNPRNNMRVPGNLNIVGTCIDDDAVGRVEIVLDGDTENPIVAEGTDFWSYFLDTTQMEEGAHTISVYGIDNKGVIGHEQTVTWHLDRRQPQTKVENYAMGALVSGKIKLTGIIADGNGIKSLAYSLDGGRNFNPVSISEDKKNNGWTFTLPLNTLQMKDGASVCWFQAVDLQGTSGLYSYLYFVDNTAPEVHITYPSETDIVNGVFSAAGLSRDAINVESLSWVFGAESGTFELIPGNPFWSLNLDV